MRTLTLTGPMVEFGVPSMNGFFNSKRMRAHNSRKNAGGLEL